MSKPKGNHVILKHLKTQNHKWSASNKQLKTKASILMNHTQMKEILWKVCHFEILTQLIVIVLVTIKEFDTLSAISKYFHRMISNIVNLSITMLLDSSLLPIDAWNKVILHTELEVAILHRVNIIKIHIKIRSTVKIVEAVEGKVLEMSDIVSMRKNRDKYLSKFLALS